MHCRGLGGVSAALDLGLVFFDDVIAIIQSRAERREKGWGSFYLGFRISFLIHVICMSSYSYIFPSYITGEGRRIVLGGGLAG